MKKILISDKLAEAGINYLNEQSDIQIHIQTGLNEDELCEIIGDYDALLIRSDTKVTAKVLQAAKNLKLIGRAGIGVDNVDIPAATEMGVIVMNTPDANATTTAELAIAHLMSLSRHLPAADRSIRAGKWDRKLVGSEVSHKTLAILGFGTIGRIASQRGLGLKMNVIAYDPFVAPEVFADLGIESVGLEELLKRADYLTLHCPLIEKTRNIIGAEQLAMMKKTAMIINCARGGLIDEAALYDALKTGKIAGAALDVYENEPPKDSPLLELDNIVFTPHLGASTSEAQVAVSVEIARQAVMFLKTGEAVNALNLPRLSAEELKKSLEFMNLATTLGKILAGLATQPLTKVDVATFGKAAEVAVRPISVAALVGVLNGRVSTPVNRVNAENLAKRQGIALTESTTEKSQDYVSLIKVTGHFDGQSMTLSGALLGGRQPRLVGINHFDIEVVPEGTLLVTLHDDKPGVISAISTVLGNANINITRMQVGTADVKEQAMAVISISEPVNDAILQQISAVAAVRKISQITL
ncbi:MAG: phosphoglycerate dehydrogenase [Methylococcaceae bacterium]|nr:phosphoglycerate dehydrogenase [Methylococcaceae bacterium]MDD1607317.1 phosphoglycerate dehydrogenase [Methylococcaceae bacterium]MDD1610230.1 phosphoglycerate dehydrogenase [Methylococcaceae bacterium]MDD1615917.1 phosphoglycerate dehydrogenase [Methylococcaceae bacterium]OYV19073.1 MAG: D-3-phosphoglycerate dehydrogenase [Methylococcaceae bacterium NSP1-2]